MRTIDLMKHRANEEIDARCAEIFCAVERQERVDVEPDYELPISGDMLARLRSNQ